MGDTERNGKFHPLVAGTDAGSAGTGSIGAVGYLQSVYRDPLQPTSVRLRAASDAAQYESPKKGTGGPDNNNAELLDREVNRRKGYIEKWYDQHPDLRPRGVPKLIEATAVEVRAEGERDPPE